MVDMQSHYSPPSPLEDSVLDSPLCGDFIGGMEDLQDISQSIEDDALSSWTSRRASPPARARVRRARLFPMP
ncbi:hypothetical protein MATL_G00245480 [Megalops atlanticus]|uniref:Uncharacterized protein n=1 Tax=Megalops atlanticus TaxID=7932 RepID=A0A9D3PAH2_MEGAT|nr:hypothetical protein MATL_G00245480 [Megalops atlanticus]